MTRPPEGPVDEGSVLRAVLAVCAHAGDESFGLGAAIGTLVDRGGAVALICLTRGGDASPTGTVVPPRLLPPVTDPAVRSTELGAAAEVLGLGPVTQLGHLAGQLAQVRLQGLADDIQAAAEQTGATTLLVFDKSGVTGHPDHRRATEASLCAADRTGLFVLAWTVLDSEARHLNHEFGTTFSGRQAGELDLVLPVDRTRQREAIRRHRSHLADDPVLDARLRLAGDREVLRWLRPPPGVRE